MYGVCSLFNVKNAGLDQKNRHSHATRTRNRRGAGLENLTIPISLRKKISMLPEVYVATPQPKKSASSVQIGQPRAKAVARIGQSSGARASSRFSVSVSKSP
jgi:hypothetical protein